MRPEDYPALYVECNTSAESNQRRHFQILQAEIVLLISIAIFGDIKWSSFPSLGILPPLAIAVSLSVLFVFTVILESKKLEKNWFNSRAVAEMVKRESWLYIMNTKPYNQQKDQKAKAKFKEFLKQIVESKTLPWKELTQAVQGAQITETMEEKRNASFDEQKVFYIASRINDQRSWYTKKAKMHRARESRLTMLMWILLALGVTLAFVNIILTDLPVSAVGMATTASGAVLSWIGAKNYGELSQSYSMVAHQLSFIEDDAKQARTDNQLKNIVSDAEETIGQEHRIWKIKRLP